MGVADDDLGERICVAVVAAAGGEGSSEQLRAWAKERLAPYKVPRTVVYVSDLPRNAMGKVIKPEVRTLITERA